MNRRSLFAAGMALLAGLGLAPKARAETKLCKDDEAVSGYSPVEWQIQSVTETPIYEDVIVDGKVVDVRFVGLKIEQKLVGFLKP